MLNHPLIRNEPLVFSSLKCDIYTCSTDVILEVNVNFWDTFFLSNSVPCPFPLLLCCHWMTRKALSCCDILGPHSHLSLCSHSISNPFWWVAYRLCWSIRAKRWTSVSVFTQWPCCITSTRLRNAISLPSNHLASASLSICAHACFLILFFKFSIFLLP